MNNKGLLLVNRESDYFLSHFSCGHFSVCLTMLPLNPFNVQENETIVNIEIERGNYSFILITTGNILLSYKFLSRINNLTKILFLTDDDWQFYEFSRHYGLCADWLITTYKQNIELYERHGFNNIIFSQWGVNTDNFRPMEVQKDIEVSLIGAPHSMREELAGYLLGHGIRLALFGNGWEYTRHRRYSGGHLSNEEFIKAINRSKINITTMKAGDNSTLQIKGRIFEVAACRAFQLVEYNPELEEYFTSGEEIIYYKNYSDLKEKIEYYLLHEKERELIAGRAYQKAIAEHTWLNRLTHIFSRIENEPKTDSRSPLQNESICVIYIIGQNEMPDNRTISSLSSQLYKNLKIAAINHSGLKQLSAEIQMDFYESYELLLESVNSDYICFIENGDIWSEEKILMQGAALKYDVRDDIGISLSNYALYEASGETKICYYSFSEGRRRKMNSGNYVIPPSSIMLSSLMAVRYKNQIVKMMETGLLLLEDITLSYNSNYRVVNMQQCHISVSLKKMKWRLRAFSGSGIKFADFWHWSKSGKYALNLYLLRLDLLSAMRILSARINSKAIIHNFLTGQ